MKYQKSYILPKRIVFIGKIILVLFMAGICFNSCDKVNEFTIGNDFIESQTKLIIIDTFHVELSTVKFDSLPTSETGVALVGSYKDETFGTESSKAYFSVGLPSYSQIESDAVFDSASLIMTYSDYSYGDTIKPMTISIHPLTEKMVIPESGYLYSTANFDYAAAVGSKTFYPKPTSTDSLKITFNNSYGYDLFSMFKKNDPRLFTEDEFLNFVKGFVLKSDNEDNRAIIGFTAGSQNINIRIYFHRTEETVVKYKIDIPLSNTAKQFNSVQYDFTGTVLTKLKDQRVAVPSSDMGNQAFLQGSIGLVPKIQFPTLQDILVTNRGHVLKAELILEPVKTSYSFFSLPEQIYLYDTDDINRLNGTLLNSNGSNLTATLTLDEMYKEETKYTYDITSYITNELADSYYDNEHGLLIGFDSEKLFASFDRLVIEGKNPSVKLRIYYLFY
jgi:hypothetical protein